MTMEQRVTAGAVDDGPIAVGITGHRLARMAGFDLDALATRIDGTLAALERASSGARFRLVGSLAEGADSIVAEVALTRGWQVDAVLPFDRAEYERDFDEPGKAVLHDLLARASSVFELPGSRHEAGGEAAAYERAGRVVLAQSECLIAVWDGGPPQGRGGAAQIVVEATGQGLPILTIHPDAARPPVLMWSGLNAHQLGPESVETVARGGMSEVGRLFASGAPLRGADASRGLVRRRRIPRIVGIAYPLMLAVAGVRRLRLVDLRGAALPPVPAATDEQGLGFAERVRNGLEPGFALADYLATEAAQLFRGAFVLNFSLAALAVTLSLLGLIAGPAFKTLLVLGEFYSIAAILLITRVGARVGWHERWLNQRRLAERLRCLSISAPLGDLFLSELGREPDASSRRARTIARRLGLPSSKVDGPYLAEAHARLVALLDDQIGYLRREAKRMHQLEHRLHRTGGVLFATTALICAGVLVLEGLGAFLAGDWGRWIHHLPLGITVVSASLPAIGAAIYGIRMQGDFAGAAERNSGLAAQLIGIRRLAEDEAPTFDQLRRLARRTAELLTQDVSQWFRASLARPLSLPG